MNNQQIINLNSELGGFISNNNYKVVEIGDNYCKMEANITDTSLNPYAIAHGGFIFGLADTAAGLAARTTGKNAVTVNANIDYLHSIKGKKIIAVAECVKSGKTISVYNVSIFDDEERLVAKFDSTYFYIN